jgi:dihydroxyacid dehydratase/phosphogluconate dehydratase
VEIARQSARAVSELDNRGITTRDILTDKAIENAMVIHAAFGGSTNLLLHIPAIAHAAGCTFLTSRTGRASTVKFRAW